MCVYFLIQQAGKRYCSFMPRYLMLGGKTVQLCMTNTDTTAYMNITFLFHLEKYVQTTVLYKEGCVWIVSLCNTVDEITL
jgi:hypothetical protein